MFLADKVFKNLRPPFSRCNEISHLWFISGLRADLISKITA
jgi:hypothetical protein